MKCHSSNIIITCCVYDILRFPFDRWISTRKKKQYCFCSVLGNSDVTAEQTNVPRKFLMNPVARLRALLLYCRCTNSVFTFVNNRKKRTEPAAVRLTPENWVNSPTHEIIINHGPHYIMYIGVRGEYPAATWAQWWCPENDSRDTSVRGVFS